MRCAAIWSAPAPAESWTIDLDDPASSSTSPGGAPELLAHGSAFVGRHLEMHALIRSCLHNQLTAVYGGKGTGKSALVLEAARYMRQRNRFPHGIFCSSLEGMRSMKAVRTRLGNTLNIPARSAQELCDLMARFNSSLLILDRCEDAIRKKMPQFVWFLTQLLQNTSVRSSSSLRPPSRASRATPTRRSPPDPSRCPRCARATALLLLNRNAGASLSCSALSALLLECNRASVPSSSRTSQSSPPAPRPLALTCSPSPSLSPSPRCERDVSVEELGGTEDMTPPTRCAAPAPGEGGGHLPTLSLTLSPSTSPCRPQPHLVALALTQRGGMPAAVRQAARRLSDMTAP